MTKFALLKYEANLGDEMQSLAAMQFLPRVDYFIRREDLNKYKFPVKTKIILNGWFDFTEGQWPPNDPNLKPLLISMHLVNTKNLDGEMEYYKKNSPVGCRDFSTMERLKKNNIDAYFSGCLTLTLENKFKERNNKIYFIELDKSLLRAVPRRYRRDVEFITHIDQSTGNRFKLAQELLDKYSQAKMVVTSRLHGALPCLALETPVLFVDKNDKDPRLQGLLPLIKNCKEKDVAKEVQKINWHNPEKNSANISEFREKLIKSCRDFINND